MNTHFVLGAPDPEMEKIEEILRAVGAEVHYATAAGVRVHPGNAYRADGCDPVLPEDHIPGGVVTIETGGPAIDRREVVYGDRVTVIDHHHPGDPGFGRPPEEFVEASSIGQVISRLAQEDRIPMPVGPAPDGGISSSIQDDGWDRGFPAAPRNWERGYLSACGPPPGCYPLRGYGGAWTVAVSVPPYPGHYRSAAVPGDAVLAAAADHCLAAAYAGECLGVDPQELARWRAASRAAFQGRPIADVLRDVEAATAAIEAAPDIVLGHKPGIAVRDMRGPVTPELPEAACRLGIGYISGPLVGPDGRKKFTCSGSPESISAFMETWAPAQGLRDIYGDPARGFAGGYAS